jgi:hypothetical protein
VSELVSGPASTGSVGGPGDRQAGQAGDGSSKSKASSTSGQRAEEGSGAALPSNPAAPSIQDLTGRWSGRMQLFGTAVGATNAEFGLLGEDWK